MNVYIMVDSEGVAGLYDRQQNVTGRLYASDSRDFMTRDVNICAEACKEAGVETVYVRDMHDDGSYIRWEKLSPAVDYIVKGGAAYRVRHAGIENCDVAILLGYHAMTGTEGAILAHTMDGGHHYFVNGVEFGEIAIDAALCGKPVIMVSGDDKACDEAKRFLPWVTPCPVKRGLDFDKGMLLSPARARALLRERTIEAIRGAASAKVFTVPSPVKLLHTYPEGGEDRVGEGETLYDALTSQRVVKKEAPLNIYIMVDIEGISGIYTREQTKKDGLYFDEGRDYITAEVNACAEACKAAGADKVYVRDAHNNGTFIRWEALSPAVDYIVKGGAGYLVRFRGLDDCDGVILLGYHAMAGTPEAVIAHTMDLDNHYFVNGVEFGEIAIDAALATEQYGKPIIMVAGDDKACAEAKHFLPGVTTCPVKRGLDFDKAVLLSPAKARALVREKTIEAIQNLKNATLFPLSSPVTVEQTIPERPRRHGEGETLTAALLARRDVE